MGESFIYYANAIFFAYVIRYVNIVVYSTVNLFNLLFKLICFRSPFKFFIIVGSGTWSVLLGSQSKYYIGLTSSIKQSFWSSSDEPFRWFIYNKKRKVFYMFISEQLHNYEKWYCDILTNGYFIFEWLYFCHKNNDLSLSTIF